MSFSTIRDQMVAVRLVRNMLLRERIPNALLFWGPSGVGKGLCAIEMVKAIYCHQADGDACDSCLACRKVIHGNHPDLLEVVPVKKARIIDVEAIDTIVEMASLRPYEAQWRVFIIHDADRMRAPAQNHLLKTLEEPPGRSVFILLSEHSRALLPTIRSRCQQVRFGSLRADTVAELLISERQLAPEVAQSIAAISQGQMTRALDLIDSEKRAIVIDIVTRLGQGEDPLAVADEFTKYLSAQRRQIEASVKTEFQVRVGEEMSKEDRERIEEEQLALVDALCRRDILELLYLFETWYRDSLVYNATGDSSRILNRDQLDLIEAANVSTPEEKIGAVEKARLYLERFLNEGRVFRDLFFVLAR